MNDVGAAPFGAIPGALVGARGLLMANDGTLTVGRGKIPCAARARATMPPSSSTMPTAAIPGRPRGAMPVMTGVGGVDERNAIQKIPLERIYDMYAKLWIIG